jgi:hypothetical protein
LKRINSRTRSRLVPHRIVLVLFTFIDLKFSALPQKLSVATLTQTMISILMSIGGSPTSSLLGPALRAGSQRSRSRSRWRRTSLLPLGPVHDSAPASPYGPPPPLRLRSADRSWVTVPARRLRSHALSRLGTDWVVISCTSPPPIYRNAPPSPPLLPGSLHCANGPLAKQLHG